MTIPTSAELLPCPFCGMQPEDDLSDTLYPSGIYWRDMGEGMLSFHGRLDRKPGDEPCYEMNCTENAGGCGASITGLSKKSAMTKWNDRAVLAQPVPAAKPTPGPWHDWFGGKRPVAGEIYVDVTLRDGDYYARPAKALDWEYTSRDSDIIAWRYAAVTPVPAPDDAVVPGGPYTNVDDLIASLKAPDEPVAHTDHPLRHWDHTCPACNKDLFATPQPEQTADVQFSDRCEYCSGQGESCWKCDGTGIVPTQPEQTAERPDLLPDAVIAEFNNFYAGDWKQFGREIEQRAIEHYVDYVAQQCKAPALSDEQIIEIIVDHKLAPYIQPALIDCIRAVLVAQRGKP